MKKMWYATDVDTLLKDLDVNPREGLHTNEIESRKKKYGNNVLKKKQSTSALVLFLLQFHQPLVYILLVASIVTAFLNEWVDSLVIFGVLLINAIIGFIQESKAIKAIDALADMNVLNATVIRDNSKMLINAKDIVVGDIVIINSGDRIPADMRIISIKELRVDEASLTGESIAVEKENSVLSENTLLADRKNMLYSSTLATQGHAIGVVVAVGDSTQIGHINQLIANADVLKTPLTIKIDKFSKILLYVILFMAIVTFLVGTLRGGSMVDMFMASVALAVGAIPEGLPAAMTIILAIGVSKMAANNAIIRKLPAVETLGSTTVICSDKTGTLTQNAMTVKQIYTNGVLYDVEGVGYSPEGEILKDTKRVTIVDEFNLRELLIAGVMCNDSMLVRDKLFYKINGDPTEGALIVSALKAGIARDELEENLVHIDTLQFESEHQYMASHYNNIYEKLYTTYVKGSLERILQRCDTYLDGDGLEKPIDRAAIEAVAQEMARQGMRVLAFAQVEHEESLERIEHHHLEDSLVFLGLQAMIDPPRQEVKHSIQICHDAGVEVKMITGDHAVTAHTIAKQIGIVDEKNQKTLSGVELEALSDTELQKVVNDVNVYARVAPEQKLRLVKALQANTNIVAMTGDGVNDAPALRQANIGIAMGITGTEVAKEAADMILLDDNFATIKDAVEEGRGVFDNIVKFIAWTLPTNVGEGLIIMFAVLIGSTLPILAVQILWINMTTAVLLGLMLAFEPKEQHLMHYSPRDPKTPILTHALLFRVGFVGIMLLIFGFGAFVHMQNIGHSDEVARTVATNIFVFGEMFYLFNCRSMRDSMFSIGVFSNMSLIYGVLAMTVLQVIFTYTSFMNTIFKSAPLGVYEWMIILSSSTIIYIVVEIEKKISLRLE